jgi:hypothetical protein
LSQRIPTWLPLAVSSGLLLFSVPLIVYLWFNLGDLLVGRAHPFPLGVALGLLLFVLCLGLTLGNSGAPTAVRVVRTTASPPE